MLLVDGFSARGSSRETMREMIVTSIETERMITRMNDSWSGLLKNYFDIISNHREDI